MSDNKSGYRIKDIEQSQRPRERLEQQGANVLNDAELLAILLRVGTHGTSAVQMGQRLLYHFEGLEGLQRATFTELCQIDGIGPAKAAQIKAAIELGARIKREKSEERVPITSPQDVANLVQYKMGHLEQEELWVLLLDSRNRHIRTDQLYRGSLNASSLIIVHNHPSGDPSPSPEDINLTRQLIEAGKMLDLPVLDHIIVGRQGFISIKSLYSDLWSS